MGKKSAQNNAEDKSPNLQGDFWGYVNRYSGANKTSALAGSSVLENNFAGEGFHENHSPKYRHAILELYGQAESSPKESGAFRIVFADGSEKFVRIEGLESEVLNIKHDDINKFIKEGAVSIDIFQTHPWINEFVYQNPQNFLEQKAKRALQFMTSKDIRPMPPSLEDFYSGINITSDERIKISYKVVDSYGVWSYQFDPTSKFVQLLQKHSELEERKKIEFQFRSFLEIEKFQSDIYTAEYKGNPRKYLNEYIKACRLLGISLSFEPIENFV